MNKIQKFLLFLKSDFGLFLVLLAVIIATFVLLSPKISNSLFSPKRQATLSEFINNSKANGIRGQDYWKFREFYSPGYFNFSKTGIDKNLLNAAKEKIGIEYNEKHIDLAFLVFNSPSTNSIDMLTKQNKLDSLVDVSRLRKENIIYKSTTGLIYKENANNIKIIFLLNNSEMKKANGFFNYSEGDDKITNGENWFNITSVDIK